MDRHRDPLVLAIESSCDETSVALLQLEGDSPILRGHVVASQLDAHRPFGGVVPEIASRQHLAALDPMVAGLLEDAGVGMAELGLIAATRGPGLASSLMIGWCYAQGLAAGLGIPCTGINHMEGHLLSPFLGAGRAPAIPHLALIVSGGHTMLVHVPSACRYTILGKTRDDAVGEAYDKVAKLLGLGYPGGPEVEKTAVQGNPNRFDFPRGMMRSGDYDFSFSGLKTAVRYRLPGLNLESGSGDVADLCASFQQAVIDVLCHKAKSALQETGVCLLTLSGGVSCNRRIASALADMCHSIDVEFLCALPQFSTDNAAMIAHAAAWRQRNGALESAGRDVDPNWAIDAD